MKIIKEVIMDDLMREVGRIGNLIDQISGINTPAELADIASNGALGCPLYYGLPQRNEECSTINPAICRQCWINALNKEFNTSRSASALLGYVLKVLKIQK